MGWLGLIWSGRVPLGLEEVEVSERLVGDEERRLDALP